MTKESKRKPRAFRGKTRKAKRARCNTHLTNVHGSIYNSRREMDVDTMREEHSMTNPSLFSRQNAKLGKTLKKILPIVRAFATSWYPKR